MNKLEIVRKEIEQVDEKILSLIKERVHLSEKVFYCKKEKCLPIIDNEREKEILEKATNFATKSNLDVDTIKDIFKLLIKMSREHQEVLSRKDNKVP